MRSLPKMRGLLYLLTIIPLCGCNLLRKKEVDDPEIVDKEELESLKNKFANNPENPNDWYYPIPGKLMEVTGKTFLDNLALNNPIAQGMLTSGRTQFTQSTSTNGIFYQKLYAFSANGFFIRAYYFGGFCDFKYVNPKAVFEVAEKGLQYTGEEIQLPMTQVASCVNFQETDLHFPADEFKNMFITPPGETYLELRMDVGGMKIEGIMTILFKKVDTQNLKLNSDGKFVPDLSLIKYK